MGTFIRTKIITAPNEATFQKTLESWCRENGKSTQNAQFHFSTCWNPQINYMVHTVMIVWGMQTVKV
jgi:hypothetical protein